jgi:hypothetical protein
MVLCSAHVGSASVWEHIYLYLRTKICFFLKKTVSYLIEQESFYPLLQKGQKDQRENREAEYRGE